MNREKCYKKPKKNLEVISLSSCVLCLFSVVQSQRHRSKSAGNYSTYLQLDYAPFSSVPSFSLIWCSSDVRSPLLFRPKHRHYPMWALSDQLRFSSQPNCTTEIIFSFSLAPLSSRQSLVGEASKKPRELKSAVQFFAYLKVECCKKDKKKNFVPFFHYRKAASATHFEIHNWRIVISVNKKIV